MWTYIGRRVLVSIPLLFGLTLLVFAMMHLLPGDPAQVMLADSGANPQAVAELRQQLGLNQPLHVQYLRYMGSLLRGDLGSSLFTYRPVAEIIRQNAPATLELAVSAICVALLIGIPLGLLAAVFKDTWVDHLTMTFAALGVSMPAFWLGLLMILVFSVGLGWLPSGGRGTPAHLIMPMLLAFNSAAVIARLVRSSMLEAIRQEYMVTARAKGFGEFYLLSRHALKNALIPIVTIVGLQFGFLLGGTVVTETVFARPGLGRVAVDAIIYKDIPVVQGVVLFVAVVYLTINLIIDCTYAFIDPRIRCQ